MKNIVDIVFDHPDRELYFYEDLKKEDAVRYVEGRNDDFGDIVWTMDDVDDSTKADIYELFQDMRTEFEIAQCENIHQFTPIYSGIMQFEEQETPHDVETYDENILYYKSVQGVGGYEEGLAPDDNMLEPIYDQTTGSQIYQEAGPSSNSLPKEESIGGATSDIDGLSVTSRDTLSEPL